MNKGVSPKKYKRAYDVLINAKHSHMVRSQVQNPAFSGCHRDDYTDAIDLALLLIWNKFNQELKTEEN